MNVFYTPNFKKSFKKFPKKIHRSFQKQINYILNNPSHPSLGIKKYDKKQSVWQARIDRNVRFYFLIKKDYYILLEIKSHPK